MTNKKVTAVILAIILMLAGSVAYVHVDDDMKRDKKWPEAPPGDCNEPTSL